MIAVWFDSLDPVGAYTGMPWWITIAAAGLSGLLGLVGGWAVKRARPSEARGVAENRLIDQLQEELGRARDLERDKMNELGNRVSRLESRELLWRQYVFALQAHINEGHPPPPPPFPAELLGLFDTAADGGK